MSEHWVQLKPRPNGREGVKLRRIRVELDAPTLARLYRQRWTIERAFLHLTVQLRCEVNTLSYPPVALFALACAMVAFNVLGVVSTAVMAQSLLEQARVVPLARYAKAPARKTAPKPGAKRLHNPKKPHVSLAKLLAAKAAKAP